MGGFADIVEILCALTDADFEAVDKFGRTPLMCAVVYAKLDAARLFLELNCDTSKSTTGGSNVFDSRRLEQLTQLLREHRNKTVRWISGGFFLNSHTRWQ